jgi:hypothetical protein
MDNENGQTSNQETVTTPVEAPAKQILEIPKVDINVEEVIANARERIVKAIQENVINTASNSVNWQMTQKIQAVVDGFIKDEIGPAVRKQLENQKQEIIQAIAVGVAGIGQKLAEKMVETTVKRFEGYQFTSIMKEIFGGH